MYEEDMLIGEYLAKKSTTSKPTGMGETAAGAIKAPDKSTRQSREPRRYWRRGSEG